MVDQAKYPQPWLARPIIDTVFILSPPFLCLLVIIAFPGVFQNNTNLPDYWWVVLVLLVDVAHVYSTLYRTYFSRQAFRKFKVQLIFIPILAFVLGSGVYLFSAIWFWRLLAYLAVFHFVRQQYGFMQLYSRDDTTSSIARYIDKTVIYAATIYPMLYWHLVPKRNFNWFVENEFLHYSGSGLLTGISIVYWLIVSVYLVKEILLSLQTSRFNIPKNLVIIGTLISWYFGIIYFNGDLSFSLLNVVSHGIPYMALIWIVGKKEVKQDHTGRFLKAFFGQYGIVLFLGLIFLLAYLEEGLWDMAVWKEHKNIFHIFHAVNLDVERSMLAFIVPFLALPQITHYVIDGFIWKRNQNTHKFQIKP